jgi:hypothetical protein
VGGDLGGLAAEFRRDGACLLRGLLDDAEVARLAEAVEHNLAAPSERGARGRRRGLGPVLRGLPQLDPRSA